MPHEQINYPDVQAIAIVDGQELGYDSSYADKASAITPDTSVHVAWERAAGSSSDSEGYVQVSIAVPAPVVLARAASIENTSTEVTSTGFYSPGLSRTEINRLIRTLRRARDAAFGSDE